MVNFVSHLFFMRCIAVAFVIVLFFSVLVAPSSGHATQLSEDAQLSLITCAPWDGELYTAFGHSALRVYDPKQNINHVFNYGIFDFNQPNFYLNFTKGRLIYRLAMASYSDFIYQYMINQRKVEEQILNLTKIQKQKLFDYLAWNAAPENKYYAYDYFYTNCSTKIRDVLVTIFQDQLHFDSTFIHKKSTIRELTDPYLERQPWGNLGIDVGLGMSMDKELLAYEQMFLPYLLYSFFDRAFITSEAGIRPLVAEKKALFDTPKNEHFSFNFWHPWYVFGILLMVTIAVSIHDFRRKKVAQWIDLVVLLPSGLMGLFLVFLWGFTDHQSTNNWDVLWALPTNVLVVLVMWVNNKKKVITHYFFIAFILTVLLLMAWGLSLLRLNVFLIPVILMLGIRYGINYWIRSNAFVKKALC